MPVLGLVRLLMLCMCYVIHVFKEYLLSHLASKNSISESPSSIILRSQDTTAAGSPEEFLKSRLIYRTDANGQEICVVKSGDDEVGVMMGWEGPISVYFVHISHAHLFKFLDKCKRRSKDYVKAWNLATVC